MSTQTIPPSNARRERLVPLALKVGLLTLALMAVVSMLVATELARRERTSLVDSKRRASEQVADLFATYDSAALAFGDEAAANQDARGLASNRDVQFVAVWAGDATEAPIAVVGALPRGTRRPGAESRTRIRDDSLDVVRPIRGPEGDVLGVSLVRVSLAPENRAYEAARARIVGSVVSGAVGLVLLLALILRVLVTAPIGRLVQASRRLERGERANLASTTNDEVGVLARAFDRMALAIADRETSLRAATERLQGVLDHMGQAILVFDRHGAVEGERSREASVLVGAGAASIAEVLFPSESGSLVEREAFEMWMGAVFGATLDTFESLADLAPTETRVSANGRERTYELEFKPIVHDDQVDRMMLVATDVTEARALRADVARKDEEHGKRVAAMRRLVAGGGQVFVRFLEGARYRLQVSLEQLETVRFDERGAVAEIFRHVHTLRGEARCFDLDVIEGRLARVEFGLSDLRTRHDARYLLDEAKAEIRTELERVIVELAAAEALFVEQSPVGAAILDQVTVRKSDIVALEGLVLEKGDAVRRVVERLASRPFGESVFLIAESVPRWLARESKRAIMEVEGRDVPIAPGLVRVLAGVLSHLVRNAIAHGVEVAEERVAANKPELATITLTCVPLAVGVRVTVSDDGAGFDVEELRSRARSAGFDGEASLDDLVANPISTRDGADELAGHGVGLDAVRAELLEAGYSIHVTSTRGSGATITIEPRVISSTSGMENAT